VIRGLSEEYGSWKTICTRREDSLSRRAGAGSPATDTSPLVGVVLPTRILASVDFPDPDSPTSARISPGRRCRSIPSRALSDTDGPDASRDSHELCPP
jgi:hypothetical protein